MRTTALIGLLAAAVLATGCESNPGASDAGAQSLDAGLDASAIEAGPDAAGQAGADAGLDASADDAAAPVGEDAAVDGDGGAFPGTLVYVHPSGTNAAGGGAIDKPYRSIQYAVDHAGTNASVLVASGLYPESVIMRPGVSIYGGFRADSWQDRNNRAWENPAYRTRVEASLGIGFTAGKNVGAGVVLDGFAIQGGFSPDDHHSYGVYLYDGASLTISNNLIEGGTGDTYGNGIGIFGSAAVIDGNLIKGGKAPIVYGIRSANASTPLIINNTILAEEAQDISYGILLNASSPRIMNNTINGGSGADEAYGIFHFGACNPKIENNLIFTTGGTARYGIFEMALNSSPASLRNNDLFDCPTALYRNFETAQHNLTDVANVNALPGAAGNVSVDPAFVSDTDWHLQASSPAEVRQGGLDLSTEGYAHDQDDQPRTAPWSIGAFEAD